MDLAGSLRLKVLFWMRIPSSIKISSASLLLILTEQWYYDNSTMCTSTIRYVTFTALQLHLNDKLHIHIQTDLLLFVITHLSFSIVLLLLLRGVITFNWSVVPVFESEHSACKLPSIGEPMSGSLNKVRVLNHIEIKSIRVKRRYLGVKTTKAILLNVHELKLKLSLPFYFY
jgi:hypothetical protein